MITLNYCPKCFKKPKVRDHKHIRGMFCTDCNQWGEVRAFRHMHLVQMYIKYLKLGDDS